MLRTVPPTPPERTHPPALHRHRCKSLQPSHCSQRAARHRRRVEFLDALARSDDALLDSALVSGLREPHRFYRLGRWPNSSLHMDATCGGRGGTAKVVEIAPVDLCRALTFDAGCACINRAAARNGWEGHLTHARGVMGARRFLSAAVPLADIPDQVTLAAVTMNVIGARIFWRRLPLLAEEADQTFARLIAVGSAWGHKRQRAQRRERIAAGGERWRLVATRGHGPCALGDIIAMCAQDHVFSANGAFVALLDMSNTWMPLDDEPRTYSTATISEPVDHDVLMYAAQLWDPTSSGELATIAGACDAAQALLKTR